MMKKYLSVIMLFSLLGCHYGTSGTWVNGNIRPEVKSRAEQLNKTLFGTLQKGDAAGLKLLMSPVLIEKSGKSIDTIAQAGAALKTNGYEIIDEYYTKNTTTNEPNTLLSSLSDSNGYVINYQALNEEMYVSVLKTTGSVNSLMILAIYGKQGDDWKLNILQLGEYEIAGKTAPAYYTTALDLYKSGDLIDAADMIITASQAANPGGLFFKYKNVEEMKNFYLKVIKEANATYKFPITVNNIKSKPVIFGATPQFIGEKGKEGIYPLINYKTNIALSDTAALKVENDALQKNIAGIFAGIEKNNNHILYQAFEQLPGGINKQMRKCSFVQKVK